MALGLRVASRFQFCALASKVSREQSTECLMSRRPGFATFRKRITTETNSRKDVFCGAPGFPHVNGSDVTDCEPTVLSAVFVLDNKDPATALSQPQPEARQI